MSLKVYTVIPVKNLRNVKSRLSTILSMEDRRRLTLEMLRDVLYTIKQARNVWRTFVVSSDKEVLDFVKGFDVEVLQEERDSGVNSAVNYVLNHVQIQNEENAALLILPSDIPLITAEDVNIAISLGLEKPSITISPSARFDGTNLLLLNPPGVIPTFYENNSFRRHVAEAFKRNVKVKLYVSWGIMLDVDEPEDLKMLTLVDKENFTTKFLGKRFREVGLKL
ncbi:MAG: 2-phospho-L-lactate guanylyltransferase [Candidatus Bathyarchaeota archaeon]